MPLGQNEIYILSALVGAKDLYGREIANEIGRITNGRYSISVGGLYTTLHRMEKKGLIEGRWGEHRRDEVEAQRRYHRITGLGRRVLAETQLTLITAIDAVTPSRL